MTRTTVLVALAVVLAQPAFALQWNIEPVYTGGSAEGDCTLLLSGAGMASIVFTAAGEVRLAAKPISGWEFEPIAPTGFFGGYSGGALDKYGSPAAAFIADTGTTTVLRFSKKSSGSWITEDITSPVSQFPDYVGLAFDSNNVAWIAFCSEGIWPPSISIKVAKKLQPWGWSVTTVSPVGDVTGPAIAIGPLNMPYISFVDAATRSVKLAYLNLFGTWSVEPVDGSVSSPASWYTSLAFDPSNRPAIAYFGDGGGGIVRLKYAVKVGGVWQKERVADLPAGSQQFCSLAIASDGTPWIAYFDGSASCLACVWKTGGG